MHRRYIHTYLHAHMLRGMEVHAVHAQSTIQVDNRINHLHVPPAVYSTVYSLLSPLCGLSGLRLLQACRSTGRYFLPTPCSLNTRRGRALPTFDTKGKTSPQLAQVRTGYGRDGKTKKKKKGMSQSSSAIHLSRSSRVGSLPDCLSALLIWLVHIAV